MNRAAAIFPKSSRSARLPILKSKWALPLCQNPAKRLILSPLEAENHDRVAISPQSAKAGRTDTMGMFDRGTREQVLDHRDPSLPMRALLVRCRMTLQTITGPGNHRHKHAGECWDDE